MNIDLIQPNELKRKYIQFLKTIDERIENPKAETVYRLQIQLILDRIRAMKENGTNYVKLDEDQQDIIKRLLEKEIEHDTR
jgi:hypothetical protein